MVLPKNVNYAEIVNPLNANLPPTNYGQNSKSAVPDSKQRMKDAVRMHNQIFVVEGGTCGCTKGTKRARIKATNSTDTTFGKERALTLSCTEMIEDDIFGECKKLTEDKATKLGKNKKSIPPIMCKGHYTPISKKWSGSASTVSDNGENTIIITSTLKCEYGGKIEIMENGQGNGEVESLSRWLDQAMKGGYSNYNSRGGLVAEIVIGGVPIIGDIADARDFSHGIENGDLIEITTSLMGLLPYVGGIAKKGGSKVLRKIFRKKGAKVVEEVAENVSGVNPPKIDFGAENPIYGKDWNKYFKDEYGAGNVQWKYPVSSVSEIMDTPSFLINVNPTDVADFVKREGWTVTPLKKGGSAGVPYEEGGGFSMNPPPSS